MSATGSRARRSGGGARAILRARLEARRAEIEGAALARITAIADPAEVSDPLYAEGLRAAVEAAIFYGVEATGRGPDEAPPVPVSLLAQARSAARVNIPLDTVLRRYFAGYSLLGFYLMEEAGRDDLIGGAELQSLIAANAATFDRLLAAVGEEHARERARRMGDSGERRAETVKRLLDGELLDGSALGYELGGFHTAMVLTGAGAAASAHMLAQSLDRRLLLVELELEATAAWLGGRDPLSSERLVERIRQWGGGEVSIGIGEPAAGISGWRFSHKQAVAALAVARRGPEKVVAYGDAALLATAIDNDLLNASLQNLFIAPLAADGDRGPALETLRAYFAAERNAASAAATLGLSRQAVTSRLSRIGGRLGRPVNSCAPELEVALRLNDLDNAAMPGRGRRGSA